MPSEADEMSRRELLVTGGAATAICGAAVAADYTGVADVFSWRQGINVEPWTTWTPAPGVAEFEGVKDGAFKFDEPWGYWSLRLRLAEDVPYQDILFSATGDGEGVALVSVSDTQNQVTIHSAREALLASAVDYQTDTMYWGMRAEFPFNADAVSSGFPRDPSVGEFSVSRATKDGWTPKETTEVDE